jgi:hypothetical protein
MTAAARRLIRLLRLKPHPEGGFFRETYRAARGRGGRCASTAILFLLPRGSVSRLHRIQSDEVWHFYSGGPLFVVELGKGGVRRTKLGAGRFQHVVRAGTWFGAELARGSEYALVGCTVAPGFEFRDFELGERAGLLESFPRCRAVVERLLPRGG